MASLHPGLVGCRVWLSELRAEREFDLGVDRVRGLGFALVRSEQGRRRRGGGPPVALGLWDELPFGFLVF